MGQQASLACTPDAAAPGYQLFCRPDRCRTSVEECHMNMAEVGTSETQCIPLGRAASSSAPALSAEAAPTRLSVALEAANEANVDTGETVFIRAQRQTTLEPHVYRQARQVAGAMGDTGGGEQTPGSSVSSSPARAVALNIARLRLPERRDGEVEQPNSSRSHTLGGDISGVDEQLTQILGHITVPAPRSPCGGQPLSSRGSCHVLGGRVTSRAAESPHACSIPPSARGTPRIIQRVFFINVDRTHGDALGIAVSQHDEQTLLILRVTGGLFHEWNQARPGEAVKPGDRILAVNGIRDDAEKLMKECEKDKVLELTIQRARVLVDLQHSYGELDAPHDVAREGTGTLTSFSPVSEVLSARGGPGRSEADEAAGTAGRVDTSEGGGSVGAQAAGGPALPESYHAEDTLRKLLAEGDVVLVRGSWLTSLARRKGILPRRQDLPADALWTADRLFPRTAGGRHRDPVEIAVVSYCWLTPKHPDPHGKQLQVLGYAAGEYIKSVGRDLAIFMDWCSLYQQPRSPEEQACFMQSLCHINLWYAHQQTWKWMLTVLPAGHNARAYEERGWPTFEWSVSQLAAVPDRMLDLGRLEAYQSNEGWAGILATCALDSREPPTAPDAFANLLESKAFSHSVDQAFLEATYRRTFEDLVASAEVLDFSFLGWGNDELWRLSATLPLCSSLRRLYLSWNRVGDLGAEAVAAVLPRCSRLCKLGLAGNPISDLGKIKFRQAWSQAGKQEEQLDLW